jgi:hypothetical protein
VPFAAALSDDADELILRLDEATRSLQLLDQASGALVAQQGLDATSEVVIDLGGGSDRLTLDASLPDALPVQLEGGEGDDTLVGPGVDSTWRVDGPDAGRLANLAFAAVENLTGAADNADTFEFSAAGGISGLVDGGEGGDDALVLVDGTFEMVTFTSLGPELGTVERDGDVIAFTGLEPATDATAGDKTVDDTFGTSVITISGSGGGISVAGDTFTETFVFTNPGDVTVNAQDGGDDITIQSLGTYTGKLTVNAGTGADTVTVQAVPSGATYEIHGDATSSDTIKVAADEDMALSDGLLDVGGEMITISGIEKAELAGGASANTFTIAGWTGTARLNGEGGNDRFTLGNASGNIFGTVELTNDGGEGIDTIDFSDHVGTLKVTTSSFTNDVITSDNGTPGDTADDSTLRQLGTLAEEIDAAVAPADVTALQGALDDLLAFVRQMKDAPGELQALRNQLPLLDREQVAGLADVVGLTDAFEKFVTDAKSKISGENTLSEAVAALNTLSLQWSTETLPGPLASLTLAVSTSYRGEDHDVAGGVDDRLELLLDFDLEATADQTADATSNTFDIDLGENAENTGVGIDGGVTAVGTLDAEFSIGLSTEAAPTAFLDPGGTFGLEVDATASLSTQPIHLSFLELEGIPGVLLGGHQRHHRRERHLDHGHLPHVRHGRRAGPRGIGDGLPAGRSLGEYGLLGRPGG